MTAAQGFTLGCMIAICFVNGASIWLTLLRGRDWRKYERLKNRVFCSALAASGLAILACSVAGGIR